MKTYAFRVVIEPDEERYYAEIPALPDCYSWGHTYEEALKNIKEAAELCLETILEDGQRIPEEDPQFARSSPAPAGAKTISGALTSLYNYLPIPSSNYDTPNFLSCSGNPRIICRALACCGRPRGIT